MKLTNFPHYTHLPSEVPVWCLTPNQGGCLHRFFDTPPVSPSGRYLAVLRFPFEDRLPELGETAQVVLIDLHTSQERIIATTAGWQTQMGANINWGASDSELFFNDIDTQTWQPFAWKLDPFDGRKVRMAGTVYHASPDGRWLISANLLNSDRTQVGYGVSAPRQNIRRNVGLVSDDGFWLTDTATGTRRMLVSIAELVATATPKMVFEGDFADWEFYGFHAKFNPQSDCVMISVRFFPTEKEETWNAFKLQRNVRFAWFTMGLDGGPIHCAVGPEEWEKGGHHATWFPDGQRISMNLTIDRDVLRFVQVNADGTGLRKMHDTVIGSGHPTVHPNGTHILTDSYAWEEVADGKGNVPLRWIDLRDGSEETLCWICATSSAQDNELRIDPHPAWDRSWHYAFFNGFEGGSRRVFVMDLSSKL